jgi:penicillin G amidase
VSGLEASVEILVDSWGIPHIYASSICDVFFAQGFNAARDRLWQIDLWRRLGLGLLSEVFGPAYAEQDRAARLFLHRGEMREEWLAYGSDTERIITAFVAGINAHVKLVEQDPHLLPPEFRLMGYRPALWSPEDVVRIRSHGLYRNVIEEVTRALVLRDFGPEAEALRRRLEPHREIVIPEGLDLSLIPEDVLRLYELATSPVEFAGEAPGSNAANGASTPEKGQRRGSEGSNN